MSGDGAKRNQILDGAGRAFGQYGFRKTTLADIVRECGVARATVYKYFSTKEDVFRAVIDREVKDIGVTVRAAVMLETTTYGRLRTAVMTQSAAIREKVNVFRLTLEALSDVIGKTHEDTARMAEEAVKMYSGILEEGVRQKEIVVEDIETTAWGIILAFKGVHMTAVTGQLQEQLPAAADRLLELIWDGLRCREETT